MRRLGKWKLSAGVGVNGRLSLLCLCMWPSDKLAAACLLPMKAAMKVPANRM